MTWTLNDLLLYTLAVYGLSWLLTRAKISAPLREILRPIPFLGPLIHCIVCTGTWISMGLALLLPWSTLTSEGLRVRTPVDLLLLTGWSVATLWGLGHLLGDAD